MTIYVVFWEMATGEADVEGVFSSLALAQEHIDGIARDGFADEYRIRPWELDGSEVL